MTVQGWYDISESRRQAIGRGDEGPGTEGGERSRAFI